MRELLDVALAVLAGLTIFGLTRFTARHSAKGVAQMSSEGAGRISIDTCRSPNSG